MTRVAGWGMSSLRDRPSATWPISMWTDVAVSGALFQEWGRSVAICRTVPAELTRFWGWPSSQPQLPSALCHLQTRVGHSPGEEAGPVPRQWALSLVIYDKDVHSGPAACRSCTVWVSAKKRLQTSGVRLRGLLLRTAGLAD